MSLSACELDCICYGILYVMKCAFMQRLAIWVSGGGRARFKNNRIQAKIEKICELKTWKFAYYATVEMYALWITYHKSFLTDRKECFRVWPDQELEYATDFFNSHRVHNGMYCLRLPLMLFYMCQCGFYLYSIVSLLKWETRRKDFAVMMSHHVITVILIGYPYFDRAKCFSDLVQLPSLFKYAGADIGASVCCGLFAISWVILRLIIFPFWIIRASSSDVIEVLPLSETYAFYMYCILNTLLLMLLVFHMYWWILIFRMIKKQLQKKKSKVEEDIRSDCEDDEDD